MVFHFLFPSFWGWSYSCFYCLSQNSSLTTRLTPTKYVFFIFVQCFLIDSCYGCVIMFVDNQSYWPLLWCAWNSESVVISLSLVAFVFFKPPYSLHSKFNTTVVKMKDLFMLMVTLRINIVSKNMAHGLGLNYAKAGRKVPGGIFSTMRFSLTSNVSLPEVSLVFLLDTKTII